MPDVTVSVTSDDDVIYEGQTTHYDYTQEEQDCISAALEWENREDFLTRGKLKSVGGAVAGAVIGTVAPPLGGAVATVRLVNTTFVIGALEALKGAMSGKAKDDVEWIVEKKLMKAVKAGVAAVPDPGLSKGALVWNVMRAVVKKNRGKDREEVATRIYQKIKADDGEYLAIVFALFTNKSDPGFYVSRLLATDNGRLAVKVLMGKIASR